MTRYSPRSPARSVVRSPGGVNRDPVDAWTFVHAAAGAAGAACGLSTRTVFVLAVGWEILEARLKLARPDLFPAPSPDSPVNSVVDILAATGTSWWVHRRNT